MVKRELESIVAFGAVKMAKGLINILSSDAKRSIYWMLLGVCAFVLPSSVGVSSSREDTHEWAFYGGDQAATKYSPLAQINTGNVAQLRVAWTFKTGETALQKFGTHPGTFEDTPLMIDDVLYVVTPYNRVVALNAETGEVIWNYDPRSYEDGQPTNGMGYTHRGVAAWRDGKTSGYFSTLATA
jgi:glucose dehydrogenase